MPASSCSSSAPFLVALFVLAAGLSILETSANPFVIAMGPEESATQRLNLAQAFNPVGANIGVLLGAVLILPRITSEAAKASMTPAQLTGRQEHDLSLVLGPYLGIAAVLVLIWLLIAFRKMSTPAERTSSRWSEAPQRGVRPPVAATATTATAWPRSSSTSPRRCARGRSRSSTPQDVVGVPADSAGWYLQASLILFLISRFVMTYLLGHLPADEAAVRSMGALGVVLASSPCSPRTWSA